MEEKILKFEKIFKDNIYIMLEMTVLYHLWCHENYSKLNIKEKEKILDISYEIYLKDDGNIDVGIITDTIMEHYKEVLKGKINRYNFYNYI